MSAIRTTNISTARETALSQSIQAGTLRTGVRAGRLPLGLVAYAAVSIALNIGVSRFTYGIMLPDLKRDLGLDYSGAGLLHAVHLGGYMIGTLGAPMLARHIGLRKLTKVAHWVVAIGAVLCALAPASAAAGPYTLAIGRLATGMGGGAAVLAAFVVAFASVPSGSRPAVSAGVWGATGGVVLLSALASPSLARATGGEWRIVFWMTAAIAICLAIWMPSAVATTGQPSQTLAAERRFSARDMLTPRWVFLLLAYFWFGAGYIGFATFLGSRLLDAHGSFGLLSATWSVFGIAIMTGATLTIFVLRAARLAPYALAAATTAGLLGAMVAVSGSSWAMVAGTFLVGLSVASTPAIITTYVRQRCSAEEYTRALGFASAIVGFGQLMGPALTGMLADRIGTQAVPLVAMVLYACAAGCGLLDSRFGIRPARASPVSSRPDLGRFKATCAS